MLDLPYPRDHDAAKNLDKVRKKLFQAIPETDQDQWPPLESWIKENSKNMKKIHETSIYGDEEKGKLASKLFSIDDLDELTQIVSTLWGFTYHTLAILGIQNSALTPEQQADYKLYLEFSKNAKKMDAYQKIKYYKKIFDPKKIRY